MRFSLRQLEVFLAVARGESVSRAARELAMSQSAVSSALADLESHYDVQLFDRVGKRVRLSELGHRVRARAEALCEQAHELEAALESRSEVGALRLGATVTIGNYVVVPVIARFLAANPDARITLAIANTSEVARRVENFEIDIGLVEGELSHPGVEVVPWRDDELVIVCGPKHPYAKRRSLDDDALRRATWIVREPGSGTRQAFDHAMHDLLAGLTIGFTLEHAEAIKGAVAEGLGLSCLSKIAVKGELERGELVRCKVPSRSFSRRFYFVFHEHKPRTAATRAFVEMCHAKAAPR